MPIRVLLVDDSAVIRGLMNKALSQDSCVEVVATASNGSMAIAVAEKEKPDIIVLDIEMPIMDGITALPLLLKASPSTKIIMASTLTQRNAEISLNALAIGASDYLAKPSAKFGKDVDEFYRELIGKIRAIGGDKAFTPSVSKFSSPSSATAAASTAALSKSSPSEIILRPGAEQLKSAHFRALAIASSTGGPQALMNVFGQISGRISSVPIFITQHMPPTFTAILAEHLSKAGKRNVAEAKNGMVVNPGQAYVAPGDYHMLAEAQGTNISLRITQDPPENFCRPAADPMLRSLSAIYGKNLLLLA